MSANGARQQLLAAVAGELMNHDEEIFLLSGDHVRGAGMKQPLAQPSAAPLVEARAGRLVD